MSINNEVNEPQAPPDGTGNQPAPAPFTQDKVNQIAGQARNEGRQALLNELTQKYGDLDALLKLRDDYEARKQAEMSELERERAEKADLAEKLNKATQQAQEAARHALQLEVGQEKGLPINLSKVLQGATREEMVAHAETLLAEITASFAGNQRVNLPNLDATAGGADKPRSAVKLTAEQKAIAARHGISEDEYAKQLQQFGG